MLFLDQPCNKIKLTWIFLLNWTLKSDILTILRMCRISLGRVIVGQAYCGEEGIVCGQGVEVHLM